MTYKSKRGQSVPKRILEIDNAPVSSLRGLLSKMFVKLLKQKMALSFSKEHENKLLMEKWNTLVLQYLKDPRNAISQDKDSIAGARGNLHKELLKSTMSMVVFGKATRFLESPKFDISVRIYDKEGVKVIAEVSETVNTGPILFSEEDNDEE